MASMMASQRRASASANGEQAGAGAEVLHRQAFLQALMAAAFMKEAECKQLFRSITGSRGQDEAAYTQALQDLNEQLSFARFKIKTVKSPVNGMKYVGFVNTHVDDASKHGSRFSPAQRDLFKQSMECIAQSSFMDGPAGVACASETVLLNLDQRGGGGGGGGSDAGAGPSSASQAAAPAGAGKKLSMAEKSATLRQLIADGWLASAPTRPGYYCLGPRTFLELNQFLLSLNLPEETRAAWQEVL